MNVLSYPMRLLAVTIVVVGVKYFEENKNKKQIVHAMLDYYLTHKDIAI